MKVVLDTNVVLSGIFFGGVPGRILAAWQRGEVTLAVSPSIFDEYRRAGERLAQHFGDLELEPLLALIARYAEVVEPEDLDSQVSRDPEDDKFLACALATGGAVVVSGDDDLLSIGEWRGIRILSPRRFVESHLSDQAT